MPRCGPISVGARRGCAVSFLESLVPVGLELAKLGISAAQGQLARESAARQLIDIGLQLVPYEELRGYLTEAGRHRAESIADAAEAAKFGTP